MRFLSSSQALVRALVAASVLLLGCGVGGTIGSTQTTPTATPTPTHPPTPTPTPVPPCVQDVPGSTHITAISGVPGIQLPANTYASAGTASGGGTGRYTVTTYTLCFHGGESAINGGPLPPAGPPISTLGHLVQAGWTPNNLFPDLTNFAYLDYCSSQHNCVNSSGSGSPFTFVGFNHYTSHSGGYTTFQLQVAKIAAPTCLNDPQYYTGTPKYTIYYDGNKASVSDSTYHFLMPPGTRVSTFKGGGTAGSTYNYFCSAGTRATVVNFLKQAMQNTGYSVTNLTASGFTATKGSSPTYRIDVYVVNPNNYYLRVFVPM